MQPDIDYLVVTTGQTDLSFFQKMNIHANTIITNQTDQYSVIHASDCVMVSTPTKGVGINRNIGLALTKADYSLIVDDDMFFYDNANSIIRRALNDHPDADIIIFNFDYIRDDNTSEPRMTRAGKISMFNCLCYGICCTLVKNSAIKKHNILFTNLSRSELSKHRGI